MQRTLLVFAKPPRMGLAKTRLAKGLGRAGAQRIARWTLAKTLRAVTDPRWQTVIYVSPDRHARASAPGPWPAAIPRRPQGRGDLGARLARGLAEAPRGPVLVIGADAPAITPSHIAAAFRALCSHDAVFGPARDGGFWLFGQVRGLRLVHPFAGVRWSGPHALADVRANLPAGARVALLEPLTDIDEAADWSAWQARRR